MRVERKKKKKVRFENENFTTIKKWYYNTL